MNPFKFKFDTNIPFLKFRNITTRRKIKIKKAAFIYPLTMEKINNLQIFWVYPLFYFFLQI